MCTELPSLSSKVLSVKVRVNFIITVATLVLSLIFWLLAQNMREIFWDIEVYQFAVNSAKDGEDPYLNRSGFDFMYHPMIIPLLKLLSLILPLKIILPIIYCIAIFFLLSVLNNWNMIPNSFNKSERMVLVILLLGFFGWSYLGLLSGNLSILGHLTLQFLGFHLILRRQTHIQIIFFLTVLAFSLIKPYFLAYLVLYLAFSILKLLIIGAGATFSFLGLWILLSINDPDSYSNFIENLTRGTYTNEDLGFSLFSSLQVFLGSWPALTLHVALILIFISIYLKNKSLLSLNYQSIWLILIAIISNPRIKEYDAIFLLVLAYIAIAQASTNAKKVILKTLILTSVSGVAIVVMATYVFTQTPLVLVFYLASMTLVWSIWFALKNPGLASKWALSGSNRRPTD